MPDPSSSASTSAASRVIFFIDGQNLYHGCQAHFGHGNTHPDLLAAEFLEGRALAGIRFYTGLASPQLDPKGNARMQRRLSAMRERGVYTWSHQLKYSQKRVIKKHSRPCPCGCWEIVEIMQGREKGIDLRIALDMIRMARHSEYDIARLVSQDGDLEQVVREIRDLQTELALALRIENVIPFSASSGKPRIRVPGCARYHEIDNAMFARIRDNTDYSVAPGGNPPLQSTPGASNS